MASDSGHHVEVVHTGKPGHDFLTPNQCWCSPEWNELLRIWVHTDDRLPKAVGLIINSDCGGSVKWRDDPDSQTG